jgi:hypothetical protein
MKKYLVPLCTTLLLCFLALPSAQAAVIPNGIYIIQMAGSDMTVAATSSKKGARLILWPYRPTATWAFKHVGNDEYIIRTNATVLDSSGGKRYNGVPIIIWPQHGKANQRWKIRRHGNYYSLTNVQTGLALDLKGNRRVKNNVFQGYTPHYRDGQLFTILPPGKKKPKRQHPNSLDNFFNP